MTEDTRQIAADNLRADFMNATTTWARWKVLNRALEWAVTASENADHYRQRTPIITPEKFDAVSESVTDHDPESWAEGAYDQLFEHYDVGKA